MSFNKAMIGRTLLACAVMSTTAPAQQTPGAEHTTPVQMVDALNGVFGKQSHGRAIHAKGIVLEGSFLPAPSARDLSRAAHFKGGRVPITVRFSDFAGIPTISDTDGLASPRGMAIKFHLQDGGDTDLVAHSVNAFPSPTTADFHDLMIAIGSSPPGTASPTPAETYLGGHPAAKAFFSNLTPPPVSFATIAYYGINSFQFTNRRGKVQVGRYQIMPTAGMHLLPASEAAVAKPNYLSEEIRQRVQMGTTTFVLQVQLAKAGDVIDNPSIIWPDSRPVIKLGLISIDRVVPDSEAAEQALMFSPNAVTDGILPADPMVADRNAAYGVSYARRHGADPSPSALAAPPISREKVAFSAALGNAPGSRLTAVVVNYGPGEKSPAHHHAGSVFAYVLSGSIRSENSATGPSRVYVTGESFFEPVGSVHRVSENASATQPASLLAVFVAPEDAVLTAPERQP
jgi:catalase